MQIKQILNERFKSSIAKTRDHLYKETFIIKNRQLLIHMHVDYNEVGMCVAKCFANMIPLCSNMNAGVCVSIGR